MDVITKEASANGRLPEVKRLFSARNLGGRLFRHLLVLVTIHALERCSFATDYHWTGLANDGLWTSAGNWDNGLPVASATNGVFLDAANGWSVITIPSGPAVAGPNMIYGPEWGATLNIRGAFNYMWYLATVQWDAAHPSVINMYDGASISGEGIALGDTWWWSGGPFVVLNMYGNAQAGINWLWWGGRANLFDGSVLSITNGVTVQTVDTVSDATRSINLAGGKLILPASFTAMVNDWISRGILLANGKTNDPASITIEESNPQYPGRTVVRLHTCLVTFQVDMSAQLLKGAFIPSVDTVDLRGSFNGWSQGVNVCTNSPATATTNVYRTSVLISDYVGSTQQFKFTYYGPNTSGTEWENPRLSQTLGDVRNRYFTLPGSTSVTLPLVFFNDDAATNIWAIRQIGAPTGLLYYDTTSLNVVTNFGGDDLLPKVVLCGSRLYGATKFNGGLGYGSVFGVNTDGRDFSVLKDLAGPGAVTTNINGNVYYLHPGPGTDGAQPAGGLVSIGCVLYGITAYGGSGTYQGDSRGDGTVYRVNTDGSDFAVIHHFSAPATTFDGAWPYDLAAAGNKLYGITAGGGSLGGGTLFSMNPNGGALSILHSFDSNEQNGYPHSLVAASNRVYGAMAHAIFVAGENGYSIVGSFPTNTWLTSLATDGNRLFGAAGQSPTNDFLFSMKIDGSDFQIVHTFSQLQPPYGTNYDGRFPTCLVVDGSRLYGFTSQGGGTGGGTIFSVRTNGSDFVVLHDWGVGDPIPIFARDVGTMQISGGKAYIALGGLYGRGGSILGLLLPTYPPQILTPPADVNILAGDNALFHAEVDGSSPMYCQWRLNGTNLVDGGRITSAHEGTLIISDVQPSDAGAYQVLVTNNYGSTSSIPANLTVVGMQDVVPIGEYNALVDFYNSTHGSSWLRHDRWLEPHNFPWFGVEVSDIEFDEDGNVIGPGHVTALSLATNNLVGPLPPDFVFFSKLEWLDLAGNQLSGNIPSGLSAFGLTLTHLDLNHNNFTGSIPADLGHLPFVSEFSISDNQLTGLIPIGIGDLVGAEYLDLSGNYLTGSIPATVATLVNLADLDFSENQLNGAIPSQLSGLLKLEAVNLSHNNLAGGIPYFASPKLEYLDLSDNFLQGPIPATGFANNLQLTRLDLSYNSLTGSIPTLSALALQHLDVGHNELEGVIPTDLPVLAQLKELNVSFNCLTGSVPDFSGMSALHNFDFQQNALDVQKTLPSGIPNLPGLANLASISNMVSVGKAINFLPQNAPVICSDPVDFMCSTGTLAHFAVGVCCGAPPLTYQWFVDGLPVSDQTSATFDLDTSPLGGPGDHDVQVLATNAYGFEWSPIAFLTLTSSGVPPQITKQPTNQTSLIGGSAIFSVSAVGTGPLHYQWWFGGTILSDDGITQGSHSNTLKLFNVGPAGAGLYSVLITNAFGWAVSSNVSLSVLGTTVEFDNGDVQMIDGQLHLFLSGLTGQGPAVISASSNLTDWVPIFTNPPGFGRIEFIDQQSTNHVLRFYRASTPAAAPP